MKTASFFTYAGPGRVSIARFAPRNTPAGFRIFKELAPGKWFNSVSREEYLRLYTAEVLARLDPEATMKRIQELAGDAEPVLLCWEKPSDRDTYCHRAFVAAWFKLTIDVQVDEIGFEGKPHPLVWTGATRAVASATGA